MAPMDARKPAITIVGAGLVGLASALALQERYSARVSVFDAAPELAAHQSGHNSGVIHSGLYYKPGSLKARTCAAGRDALYRFLAEEGIEHRRCGKLVVATRAEELPALDELERRGRANGLQGLERLGPEGMKEREPEVAGIAGLWVEETGVVDYKDVVAAYARRFQERGGYLRMGVEIQRIEEREGSLFLHNSEGQHPEGILETDYLVGCAGLGSDRLARACGVEPGVSILPFRGDYFELVPERRHLVNTLIYPVPDPSLPFLGVHLTRTIHDKVEMGPNAVPALHRTAYGRFRVSPRDAADVLLSTGTWRLFGRYWKTGLAEIGRSLSRTAFARDTARLVPAVRPEDIVPAGCGIRAQAVDPQGRLVDDFRIVEGPRSLHVVNAPSPGATASLAIGAHIAERAGERFELREKKKAAAG